jgi:hypothetical protein
MKRLSLIVPFLVLLIACTSRPIGHERIDNIVRVFMNVPGSHYTFLIETPGSNEITERQINVTSREDTPTAIAYKKDVPADQKMWVELNQWTYYGGGNFFTAVVHISSELDIEGGGWNHGKFGSGINQVVQ